MCRKITLLIFCTLLPAFQISCTEKKQESTTDPEPEKTAPQKPLTKHQYAEPHLGTVVRIVFYSSDKKQADQLAEQCFTRIKELNAKLSDYLPDSEVSQLSKKPIGKPHPVSDDLLAIATFAQSLSEKTDGAFDITLGKHTQRWRKNARTNKVTETAKPDLTNYRDLGIDPKAKTITLNKPLKIDLGAIGKGYIADEAMRLIQQAGHNRAAIIIGGETVLADPPPNKKGWRIGIENPARQIIGKLTLSNTAISTSGDSYQFFEQNGDPAKRQAHLIDPKTRQGKANRLNVTTIAPTAMQADAWATALRILPTEKALTLANQEPQLEALFLPHQKNSLQTNNLPTLEKLTKACQK